MNEVNDRVKRVIIETLMLELSPEELGEEDDLSDKLGLDSLGFLQVLTGLEEEFGIEIQDDQVNRKTVGTVRKLAELVGQSQLAQKGDS